MTSEPKVVVTREESIERTTSYSCSVQVPPNLDDEDDEEPYVFDATITVTQADGKPGSFTLEGNPGDAFFEALTRDEARAVYTALGAALGVA